jgi:hypothetical protein
MPKTGGYTAAFTHPDPLDPNDVARQRTQPRSKNFPYDRDTSYGSAVVPDSGGAARQVSYGGQLTPWFMPDDDGDIEQEAIGTPINFKQSDGGGGSGALPLPGQSRGFAGSNKPDLEVQSQWDVFGETDLRDLNPGELRDISAGAGAGTPWAQVQTQPAPTLEDNMFDWELGMDEEGWPGRVRDKQLRSLEDFTLGECFAVYNEESDEVISLLETLDWEG